MSCVKLANRAHNASLAEVRELLIQGPIAGQNKSKWQEFGGIALLQAAECNDDVNVLRALLEHPEIDVNVRDELGRTPLHLAVTRYEAEFAKFLLARDDLDVNACAHFDLTPLHLAARLGCTQVLGPMLDDPRVKLDVRTVDGFTVLHLVIEGDDASSHPYFLSNRRSLQDRSRALVMMLDKLSESKSMLATTLNARDSLGRTALHYAAECGNVELLEPLMMLNATNVDAFKENVNAKDYHGFTPLHLAVMRGRENTAQALLLQVPSINPNVATVVTSSFYMHVSMVNSCQHSSNCLKLFPVALVEPPLESNNNLTALHLAARDGNTCIVEALLGCNAIDVDARDRNGLSALHYAVRRGHIVVAEMLQNRQQLLLRHQPRPVLNVGVQEGATPLMYAVTSGNVQMVEALWDVGMGKLPKEGADLTTAMLNIVTALLDSVSDANINEKVPRFLLDKLECTAEIGKYLASKPGRNLAHWAAYFDHASLLTHILKWQPADYLNAKDDGHGGTPLHIAVRFSRMNATKVLCHGNGSEVILGNAENRSGNRPFDLASFFQLSDICDVLLLREDVKTMVDRENNLRMTFMDATHAVVIAGALFATITYSGWLQPPLGYTPDYDLAPEPLPAPPNTYANYVSIRRHLTAFFILNCMSFVFAIGTVLLGLATAFPPYPLAKAIHALQSTRWTLELACLSLCTSATCAVGAFVSAGLAVLPPHSGYHEPYKWTLVGCACVLGRVVWYVFASTVVSEILYWRMYFRNRPGFFKRVVVPVLMGPFSFLWNRMYVFPRWPREGLESGFLMCGVILPIGEAEQ